MRPCTLRSLSFAGNEFATQILGGVWLSGGMWLRMLVAATHSKSHVSVAVFFYATFPCIFICSYKNSGAKSTPLSQLNV
ncbi:MAG: hypothetical protein Ta2A_23360 [Treponemataceae bacterium]|nr:MAG: hypothetical protein Ta2A_23360 [Treponemataceae bacterium]